MKNLVWLFSFSILVSLSCDRQSNHYSEDKQGNVSRVNENDKNSVHNLESTTSQEITGLWKLYKSVYYKGESYIERDNSFMEIKPDKSYETNRYKGRWFLSFCKDTSAVAALFHMLRPEEYGNRMEANVTSYMIQNVVENKTAYLKLTDLTNGKQTFYVRQQ